MRLHPPRPIPAPRAGVARSLLAVPAALALLLLGGCGAPAQRPSFADATTPAAPATTTAAATAPASSAAPVVTRDGPCPYFTTSFAMETVGQHLTRSTVTSQTPYPACVLYRPDGNPAVKIQVIEAATVIKAQEQAVTELGASANPVPGVGDKGTVAIVGDGARLVVSKGRYVLELWINQQSSLQARLLAAQAVMAIH